MINKFIIVLFTSSLILSQNFIYDSDDWYALKSAGSIRSITEGPFSVYFATDNGIFSYNFLDDIIEYDFELNRGMDVNNKIISIHYDKYSDQVWIATDNGIFYKNSIFNTFNKVDFNNSNTYNLYNIGSLGSVNKYVIAQYGLGYIFIDSFSGSEIKPPPDFNLNDINWSPSLYDYRMNDIDVSNYYADNWIIGFKTIIDKYGKQESVNIYFEDSQLNLWFGTNKGSLIKGYKYTNKVDVLKIGPFSKGITSVTNNKKGDWFLASGKFRRYGSISQFNYSKESNPFISIWNEYDNSWKYLNESDFSELSNPDVNCIYYINDNSLAIGLMRGLLITSLDNFKDYQFIDMKDGIADESVFKIDYYDNKLFIMTIKGISIYSLESNFIIEENILDYFDLSDSEVLDMALIKDKLYFSTKAGLFQYYINERKIDKISNNIFFDIDYHNNSIYGLNHDLWLINLDNYNESILRSGSARNFKVTDTHIWMNLKDSIRLIDLDSREEWIYDHNDELNNIEVFDIINDGDWVCLLTDNGLIFYNWSNYHY